MKSRKHLAQNALGKDSEQVLSGNTPTLEDMVGIALRALPIGAVGGFPGQRWVWP